MNSYGEVVTFVEDHGGRVTTGKHNPRIDHIWDLVQENKSLCGVWFAPTGDRGGQLCGNCMRAIQKWEEGNERTE